MRKYVEVVGTGTASAAPDRARLHLGVSVTRPEVAASLARLSDQVRALGSTLREAGITADAIRTTGATVGEDWSGPDGTRSGYRAEQVVAVTIDDPDQLPAFVDAAAAALGDDFRLQHLAWELADPGIALDEARTVAFEDARATATTLARLAGHELGKLLRVVEGTAAATSYPRLALAKADADGFAAERGSTTVDVTLVARWAFA